MELYILLLSASLVLLVFTFRKSSRRLKIFSVIIILISSAVILVIRSFSDISLKGEEIVSSFLAGGSTVNAEKLEIPEVPESESPEWGIYNPGIAELRRGSNSFSMKPNKECLWGKEYTGPMIFRTAEGNFYFSSMVRTRRYSDTLSFPAEHASQFGGIILRDPDPQEKENNIYIAIGLRDSDLRLEVKSTVNGNSTSDTYKWPSADAELMIQREAKVFGLYARPYGTKGAWTRIKTFYRPDLPNTLQTGLIVYSYSYGKDLNDFIVYFGDVNVRRENE